LKLDEKRLRVMGLASLIPGLQAAADLINAELAEYRGILADFQAAEALLVPKKKGRPSIASKTLLEAAKEPVVPVAAKKKAVVKKKKGHRPPRLPDMVNGDHVMLRVAEELGYSSAWGLQLLMRTRGLKWKKAKVAGRSVNLISPADYDRVKQIREGMRKAA